MNTKETTVGRRMRGQISFSYLADPDDYPEGSSWARMARLDQELFLDDVDAIADILERADDMDIAVVPALALVPDLPAEDEE